MQVRKFEAKTMKEALELVKVHLGPEAIILSAKDSHRGFGLMGEKSVEVTAAVSDETLRKKKMAESKLREDLRERFQQIPAAKQKEFIDRVFKNAGRELVTADGVASAAARAPAGPARTQVTPEQRAQVSGMRYIDIPDDDVRPTANAVRAQAHARAQAQAQAQAQMQAQDRVRVAAQRARQASAEVLQDGEPRPQQRRSRRVSAAISAARGSLEAFTEVATKPTAPTVTPTETTASVILTATPAVSSPDVRALEAQLKELKGLVEKFQTVPQISMTMHPGAEQGLPFELSPVYQRLTAAGIQVQAVTQMLKKAQKELDHETLKRPALVEAWIVRQLLNTIEVVANPNSTRYHVFAGSTGQGKTTSLVKFASHLVLKEKKKIAIISLDTIKVGAADQLRIYAQILNVPFAIVRNPSEWKVAEEKLKHVDHILVDCPGFNLRSMDEADWLKQMIPPAELGRTIHYVQSVLARDEEAMDLASRYQMLGFHDVIFTRLDESSRQGLILNFQERFRVPLHSFGLGSRIPEDYEFASKERVIDFLFKLSKVAKKEESA